MTKVMISELRDEGEVDDDDETPPALYVCHGPPRCTRPALDDSPCRWCEKVAHDDPRSTDEIVADMERSDA